MGKFLFTFSFLFYCLVNSGIGQNSPLAEGTWAKFRIEETGMYRLTYQDLQDAGISPSHPNGIKILGLPGGPLPQPNDASYPDRLAPLPYVAYTTGENSFGPGDFLVFFAEGAHTLRYQAGEILYEHNPYDSYNYVFVSTSQSLDPPVPERMPVSEIGTETAVFSDLVAHENTSSNLLQSGRTWYGESFESVLQQSFDFDFALAQPGGQVHVTSRVMAQSFGLSSFNVEINGAAAGEQPINKVDDFLNPPTNNPYTYSVKGREREDEFSGFLTGTEVVVTMRYNPAPGTRSVGYLDYLIVEAESRLELNGSQTVFSSELLTQPGNYVVLVGNTESNTEIWDVSDILAPEQIRDFSIPAPGTLRFGAAGSENARYVAFNPSSLPIPELEESTSYSDLMAGNPELLIVTHPDFLAQAQRLADFRRVNDGLDVLVVTTDDVYDHVASGRKDLTAIRNLARHFYTSGSLRYLLLFGKGSYDYNNVLPFFSNYVPVYQSRNSLYPLDTYASDDYFGFMDSDEGEWPEVNGGNHTMDIGVGRIPITTIQDAQNVVDKIIRYSSGDNSLGDWRNRLLFVADDGDFNLHHSQSDRLANMIDSTATYYRNKRLFLGTFPQNSTGGGEISPKASESLNTEIRRGSLVVNYTGHGNELSWTQEQILTNSMIPSWRNIDRLPLFVTATCEFGRHDDPARFSGGELILTESGGGGIGILTTGRPVFANSNFRLNEAFFKALFVKSNGEYGRLGDIMRETKNNSVDLATDPNRVGNRNFSLLGDPSQRLAYPEDPVVISSILVNGQPSDTLRSGDKVRISGAVSSALPYEGTVDIAVLDKPAPVETIYAPTYVYHERINTIFQGTATVRNGLFSAEFIVPLNISNKEGAGRIHVYAMDNKVFRDGIGGFENVHFSSAGSGEITDEEGPDIRVFFGDSTNQRRTDIPVNTLLFVNLRDESGINTSGFGVGNNLTAVLDDSATFILNDYYKALPDTYMEGWAVIPLNDLVPGSHVVTITARDVFNNSSQVSVIFEVADPGTLILNSLRNYPNPVTQNTTVKFSHNRPGDNLDIRLTLMDTRGSIVSELTFYQENSGATVTLPTLVDLPQSENLAAGIYIYGVEVRSRQDGATDHRFEKMMVLNEK